MCSSQFIYALIKTQICAVKMLILCQQYILSTVAQCI